MEREDGKHFWDAAARRYVEQCGARGTPVRASEFAAEMRRSRVALARELHETVGSCPKSHLLAQQLEVAARLLRETSRSTVEIAADAGFGTVRSFYRAFRRATGKSPTEYRETAGDGGD